jgi:hypothetical protein
MALRAAEQSLVFVDPAAAGALCPGL